MRIEHTIGVAAPRHQVWPVVSDFRGYPTLFSGVTRWEPVGELRDGCGARFTVRLQVGSAQVGGLVEIVEWEEPGDLAWTSVSGVEQRGRWRLRERGPGATDVTLRLAYRAPGGLLALVADRLAARTVSARLRETLANLQRQVEIGR